MPDELEPDLIELANRFLKKSPDHKKRLPRRRKSDSETYETLTYETLTQSIPGSDVLFGLFPVYFALRKHSRKLFALFIKKELLNSDRKLISDILHTATKRGVPVKPVDSAHLSIITPKRPSQGVCLHASRKMYSPLIPSDIPTKSSSSSPKKPQFWLILDRILDPMNVGAILRSAYYFGADRIVMTTPRPSLSPIVSKASAGAMELFEIYKTDEPVMILEQMVKSNWQLIGTVPPSRSTVSDSCNDEPSSDGETDETSNPRNTAVIIGSEGSGISAPMLSLCSRRISIRPHPGRELIGSLNVSVAAAIILQRLRSAERTADC